MSLEAGHIGIGIDDGKTFAEAVFALGIGGANDLSLDAITVIALAERQCTACACGMPADEMQFFFRFGGESVKNELDEVANGRFARFICAFDDIDSAVKFNASVRKLAEASDI